MGLRLHISLILVSRDYSLFGVTIRRSWSFLIHLWRCWKKYNYMQEIHFIVFILDSGICTRKNYNLTPPAGNCARVWMFFFLCLSVCAPLYTPATTTPGVPVTGVAGFNAPSSLLHAADRGTAWEPKHLLRSRRSARSERQHVRQWDSVERAVTAR